MKKFSLKKIGLLLIALYVGFTFINQQIIMFRQHKDIDNYTSELQSAQEKNQKLQDEIKLSQDSRYIEKLAREKLGLIKEGESPVVDSK
ncbi:septum formation initiator family protein [Clostridium subterminale]|uniref:Septum formation initiator family protein n=1 Tax=Clostridium subterminale TaxID=1550 RepID=A0ABN1KNF7_CLOSU